MSDRLAAAVAACPDLPADHPATRELRQLGACIDTIDVGGGLGVDYEGTRSRSFCSI